MSIRLETERLVLRPMEARDVESHVEMMQDPGMAAYLTPDGKVRPRMDEWRGAAMLLGHWQIRGFGFFSVEEKATGDWVGRVGPWKPEGWPALECGWGIRKEHWGKGYAPEAAIASVRWIFDQFPDLPRVISLIDPENANSQAVAKKIGEEKSGEVFELWGLRLDVWSAGRKDWLARFG